MPVPCREASDITGPGSLNGSGGSDVPGVCLGFGVSGGGPGVDAGLGVGVGAGFLGNQRLPMSLLTTLFGKESPVRING